MPDTPPAAAPLPDFDKLDADIFAENVGSGMGFEFKVHRLHNLARAYLALSANPGASVPAVAPEGREAALLAAINKACGIIELGDQRLLAGDGPAGGQPPELSLAEWRTLYVTLDKARKGK